LSRNSYLNQAMGILVANRMVGMVEELRAVDNQLDIEVE
jgi:hypothetical protein